MDSDVSKRGQVWLLCTKHLQVMPSEVSALVSSYMYLLSELICIETSK